MGTTIQLKLESDLDQILDVFKAVNKLKSKREAIKELIRSQKPLLDKLEA